MSSGGSGCSGLSSFFLAAVAPSAIDELNSGCSSSSGSVRSTCWPTMGHAMGLALSLLAHCLTFASSAPSNPQPMRMWFTAQAHHRLLTLQPLAAPRLLPASAPAAPPLPAVLPATREQTWKTFPPTRVPLLIRRVSLGQE